ncbi:MAG: Fe-S cluster assembly protein SufD [Ignavibacteria bacterium]|nr:Fe-S cluster assembly protein SufD [Ignavibacteria bacterium]
MSDNPDLKQRLLSEFSHRELSLNGTRETPLNILRRESMQRFQELGFPTIRNEEWKYANIMSAIALPFALGSGMTSSITPEDINPFTIQGIDAHILVFVNGIYAPKLSNIHTLHDDVSIGNIATILQESPDSLTEHFTQEAAKNEAFTALNAALTHDGAFISIPNGAILDKPIHVMMITDSSTSPVMVHPLHIISCGRSSSATIIHSAHTVGTNAGFTNSVVNITVGENANLRQYIIQNDCDTAYSVQSTFVKQERDSTYSAVTVSLGGAFIRNNHSSVLGGENSVANYYGLVLGSKRQLIDNHTLADHATPHCQSNELYKYILDERSTGVFNGKIIVREDAQKTNAYQSNKTILLSDTATINTKPQLEIFADDVKCSHGATSGQLDEEALFYMRSRGISAEKARALLLHAFAADVLEKISIAPLRTTLDHIIAERLHDNEEDVFASAA